MPPCLPPLYFLRQGLSPCYTESSGFQLANPPESSCVSPQCCAGIAGIYCHTQLLFGCWSSKYPGPFLRAHIYHPAVNTKTLLTVVCRNLSKKNGFRKEVFFFPPSTINFHRYIGVGRTMMEVFWLPLSSVRCGSVPPWTSVFSVRKKSD